MQRFISIILLSSLFLGCFNLSAQKNISLEDIWLSPKFYPKRIQEIRSMNDGEHYCFLQSNKIIRYKYKTAKEVDVIYDAKKDDIQIDDYQFNASEKKILLATESEAIYRHSFSAYYYIYDIKEKTLIPLSKNGKQQLAEFSPCGKKIAFVRENNLFLYDIATNAEVQITTDGKQKHIINGTTDWVYEEEFALTKGFYWSPKGDKIAYYKMDESEVKEFCMMIYGNLYPEKYEYKYPKAGEDNSIVDIYIYDLQKNNHQKIDLGEETDIYIPRIAWTRSNDFLAIQRLNRLQNHLEILKVNVNDFSIQAIYNEKNKYYIDITDNLYFLENGNEFIISSEQDGYNHLYLYDINGNFVRQLTKGNWDVVEFSGYDEENQVFYYISTEDSPINHLLYSTNIKGEDKKLLSKEKGFHHADFSNNFQYYINSYSDINTPHIYRIYNAKGKEIHCLEDNKNLRDYIKEANFSSAEFFSFTTSEDVKLNGWMIKPPDFDSNKKYPVLMHVYGGPGSQTVKNSWGYFNYVWHQMLAQNGYIVVSVDNRGTGGRGEEFKKCTYLQLGKLETIDQIEAAKYLRNLSYVDKDRIGIWGWSYGGYMSTLCLTKGADYFSTAIAVAPVTNWRYYDNIYTERFMRTPQENADGYDNNSPILDVKKMKGKYLLIHGTADDNVHVQNAYDLVTALVNANKQFEMQFYPNKNHGIYGGYTRYHLYKRMTEFIYQNL